ncbi:DUF5687 family protein [Flavobacterium rhizosphaerae]|uniref:DUF5687 family protein n=1 Tax=Flavobacterium rhizosphaerae TaxID=3163298 RepID=A0ABW8YY09_9FLAO
MFKKFIWLEWKAFTRASSFSANVAIKILMILGAIYFCAAFLIGGVAAYMLPKEEMHADPVEIINRYVIYYFLFDLIIRLLLQQLPVMNIRPLLTLPVRRGIIVHYAMGKSFISVFNIFSFFFFVPIFVLMLVDGRDPLHTILWFLAMWALVYCNNLLNILLNKKTALLVLFLAIAAALIASVYYSLFDVTLYTAPFFDGIYQNYLIAVLPVLAFAGLYYITYRYYMNHLRLDTGLKGKEEVASTQDFTWLNRFGTMATFLKNDLKLILRNKRSKTSVMMSVLFIFYGLAFYTGALEMYDNTPMKMFASIFVTGGFMFTFGQFVPSWDSAYYPLMMSQNIPYRQYIASKWWLMVIAVAISTLLCSFYAYFGIEIYLMILSGAIFNIGVNSLLVLLGGAYLKTPIDLASAKQAFGNKQAFNVKTLIIGLPKLLLPMGLYWAGAAFISPIAGFAFVAGAGFLGLVFRKAAFRAIERIYKSEKYSTIAAYKQIN